MQPELHHTIVNLINDRQSKGMTHVLIAIDGAGGAGKSTLARQIQEKCNNVTIIEMDNFYRPEESSVRRARTPEEGYRALFDWTRFRNQVLKPIRDGRSPSFQAYDWNANKLNGWKSAPLSPIIIVEGVYALRPELKIYYDISLVVEASRDICTSRLRSRGDAEEDIQMWQAAEDWYFTNIKPQSNCDLIVSECQSDSTSDSNPDS